MKGLILSLEPPQLFAVHSKCRLSAANLKPLTIAQIGPCSFYSQRFLLVITIKTPSPQPNQHD